VEKFEDFSRCSLHEQKTLFFENGNKNISAAGIRMNTYDHGETFSVLQLIHLFHSMRGPDHLIDHFFGLTCSVSLPRDITLNRC
jgi:hypothetical protein